MDRDRTVGTGFRVDPAELATVADHLHDTAEDAVARARHEYVAAADDPAVIHRRRRGGGIGETLAAAPRLPDWLPDLDAAWQHQRAELVVATHAAAAALARTGSTYRDIDERLGAVLRRPHLPLRRPRQSGLDRAGLDRAHRTRTRPGRGGSRS